MRFNVIRARRPRRPRVPADRLEQHVRLQRELLWHPRLGLLGGRTAVPVRIPNDARRSWIRR